MSEAKHTPGPWNVGKTTMDRLIYADSEHAFDLAIVRNGGSDEETEANAALIAAAPDLLAACKTALDRFQALEDAEEATEADIAARCAVQDAIRRAETGAP